MIKQHAGSHLQTAWQQLGKFMLSDALYPVCIEVCYKVEHPPSHIRAQALHFQVFMVHSGPSRRAVTPMANLRFQTDRLTFCLGDRLAIPMNLDKILINFKHQLFGAERLRVAGAFWDNY